MVGNESEAVSGIEAGRGLESPWGKENREGERGFGRHSGGIGRDLKGGVKDAFSAC